MGRVVVANCNGGLGVLRGKPKGLGKANGTRVGHRSIFSVSVALCTSASQCCGLQTSPVELDYQVAVCSVPVEWSSEFAKKFQKFGQIWPNLKLQHNTTCTTTQQQHKQNKSLVLYIHEGSNFEHLKTTNNTQDVAKQGGGAGMNAYKVLLQ